MKNILLPTDFSPNSQHAMDYAMKYFKGTTAHFILLNIQKSSEYIMDDLISAGPGASVHEAISGDNIKQLEALVAEFRESYELENFSFETIFDFDVFIDAIAQTVKAKDIDLIVMGTNGASGAKEAIFGSNTLQVIRNINCPVMAIPEYYSFHKPDKVLLSINNNEIPSKMALVPLTEYIESHHPELHILAIYDSTCSEDEQNELQQAITDLFPETSTTYHKIEGIPVPDAIRSFTQLKPMDMHALLIKQKSFLERFLHGSDTSKISYGSDIPLMVLKE